MYAEEACRIGLWLELTSSCLDSYYFFWIEPKSSVISKMQTRLERWNEELAKIKDKKQKNGMLTVIVYACCSIDFYYF